MSVKVFAEIAVFFVLFHGANSHIECFICNNTSPVYNEYCLENTTPFLIEKCAPHVKYCYIHILTRYKYKRGCATLDDPVYKFCVDNLMEDCRECQFDRCNGVPIVVSMANHCAQSNGSDTEVTATSCELHSRLLTEDSLCFWRFDGNGSLLERGCFTKYVYPNLKENEMYLTCNFFKCNELTHDTDSYCATKELDYAAGCAELKLNQIPGCYILYEYIPDTEPLSCITNLTVDIFKQLTAVRNTGRKGAICFNTPLSPLCNKRSNPVEDYRPTCHLNHRCLNLDDQCYSRFDNWSSKNLVAHGCVTPYVLGLNSPLTFLCRDSYMGTEVVDCNLDKQYHDFGCHKCQDAYCNNVFSALSTELFCGKIKQCYTYIDIYGRVYRGCGMEGKCAENKARCYICEGFMCNNDIVIPNSLMCPQTEFEGGAELVKLLPCDVVVTTATSDKCVMIRDENKFNGTKVSYNCLSNAWNICSSPNSTCQFEKSAIYLPSIFFCYQCRSDLCGQEICDIDVQRVHIPSPCKFVFTAPYLGCYARYNQEYKAVERGCIMDMDPATLEDCINSPKTCTVCNTQSCNFMRIGYVVS